MVKDVKAHLARRRGQALLATLIVALVLVALGLVIASLGDLSARRASTARAEDQLRSGCRLGLAQLRAVLWDAYETAAPVATLAGAKDHLDDLGLLNGQTRWLDAGVALATSTTTAFTLRPGAGLVLGTVEVQVFARRQDGPEDVFLFLRADAIHGGERRFAEEVVRLGRRRFEGFRYALLADSLDRVLRGATIDHAGRTRLSAPGPYDRVKVGALGPLRLQPGTTRTTIAGTLYTRRAAVNLGGARVSAPPGGPNGVRAEGIDAASGHITGPPLNDLLDGTSAGEPYGNFYADYPEASDEQFDGAFPSSGIPTPVEDLDGDRVIDDDEWTAFVAGRSGTVTNAVILGISDSAPLPLPVGLPAAGNLLEFATGPGTVGLNLLIVGTALTPATISGDVAVDGDLVITGPITGRGTFHVRGNIYLLGDVIYQQPGSDTIGFAAGGSIVTGDYKAAPPPPGPPLVPAVVPTLVSDAAATGFVAAELAAWNRMEWTRTQPFYDGTAQRPTSVDTGVANVAFVAGYKPRFYTFDGAAAPKMFLGSAQWKNGEGVWTGSAEDPDTPIDLTPYGGDVVVQGLDPTSAWLSPLAAAVLQNLAAATRAPGTTRIDGLLFSNNGIVLRAPTGGAVRNLGAVIAQDVGVEAPAGLRIDYDDRVRGLLQLDAADPETVDAFAVLRREQ